MGKKIQQLTAAVALTGTEEVPIHQTGNDAVKTTTQDIANLFVQAGWFTSLVFVNASRDFLSSDVNKLLVLSDNVEMTVPNSVPFASTDKVGLFNQSTFGNDASYHQAFNDGAPIFMLNGEIVVLQPFDFGGEQMLGLSTAIRADSGQLKTTLRYLYDHLGDFTFLPTKVTGGATRDISANDSGKLLVISGGTVLTVPLGITLTSGQVLAIQPQSDTDTFNLTFGGDQIHSYFNGDTPEIVLLGAIVEGGQTNLYPLGTFIKNDSGTFKTGLRYLSDNSSGGGAVQTATYAAWDALRVAGTLPISMDIIITDRGEDFMLLKTNHTGDGFREEGSAGFINCDYAIVGTMQNDVSANPRYADIFAQTGVNPSHQRGTWSATYEGEISTGDITMWNNTHYQCIDQAQQNGTDPATNVLAYAELSRATGVTSNLGYVHVWETVMYDFPNDTILERRNDKATIKGSTNITNFPWGDNIEVVMETSSCNLDLRNNVKQKGGSIYGRITGASHNITLTENMSAATFDVSGSGQTISINKIATTTTLELHLIGFSAGVSGNNIGNTCTIILYVYNSSLVNIDSLANNCVIKARYYDGSSVSHASHAGTITWCEFSKGFTGTLSLNAGVTWSNNKCSYNGYSFTFPAGVNYANRELGQFDSSFDASLAIDGLTTIDISSDTYNFCAILLLTSANATETIDTIIGGKLVNLRVYPETGLAVTWTGTGVASAVSGDIILPTVNAVTDGTNRDFIYFNVLFDGAVSQIDLMNYI